MDGGRRRSLGRASGASSVVSFASTVSAGGGGSRAKPADTNLPGAPGRFLSWLPREPTLEGTLEKQKSEGYFGSISRTGGPLTPLTPGVTVTVRVTVRRDLVWIRTVHPAAFRVLSPPRSSPRARSPGTARFKSQTRFRRRSAIGGVSRRSRVRFLAGTPFPELFRTSDKTLGRDADRKRAARDSSIPCSRRITTTARMARDLTRWVEKKGRLVGWSPGKSCDARAFSRRRRSRARRRGARTRRVAVEKKFPGSIPGWAERASFLLAGSRFEASS